jgi:tRNA dimethylallyltransferase
MTSISSNPPAVVLLGTTASGKSELALSLAKKRGDVEIVSADSMCVYRGMDIATAKPSMGDRSDVRHHMVDTVDPCEDYSVARYQEDAFEAIRDVTARGRVPLVVGGTGLYYRALVDSLEVPGVWPEIRRALEAIAARPGGLKQIHAMLVSLDPLAASRVEGSNQRRVVRALEVTLGSGRRFSSFGPGLEHYPSTPHHLIGISFDAAQVDLRIQERFSSWMESGLLDEVASLLKSPNGVSRTARQALGYREIIEHLEESTPLATAVETAIRRTRALARRQWKWFRRDPRIQWTPGGPPTEAALNTALDRLLVVRSR